MQQDPKRLIVFIILSIGVLGLWSYMFPPPKPPKQPKLRKSAALRKKPPKGKAKVAKAAKASANAKATSRPAGPTSAPTSQASSRPAARGAAKRAAARPAPRRAAPSVPPVKTKTLTFKGKKVVATATSQGGALLHWRLWHFYETNPAQKPKTKKSKKAKKAAKQAAKKAKKRDKSGKTVTKGIKKPRMDLVSRLFPNHLPFTEQLKDKRLVKHDLVPYPHASKPKKNILKFWGRIPSTKGGHVEIEKRYIYDAKRYRFKLEIKLTNRTSHGVKSQLALRLRDAEDPKRLQAGGMFSFQQEQINMLCRRSTEEKPTRVDYLKLRDSVAKLAKKSPTVSPASLKVTKILPGDVGYMAIDRRYFVMAAVPNWGKGDRGIGCTFRANILGQVSASVQNVGVDIEPGKSRTISFIGFYGPKYYDTLKRAGGKLETTIDFGMFAFLCKPMLWFMQLFYDWLKKIGIFNWGLAIILLTLLVKLLLWPMTHKSMESMKKMQRLKPEMDKLKEKYGDDKEAIQRETMNLYVKHGINPVSGCLPMLLQMPIWIALYQTILYSVELYQAPFIPGWIDDLSARDPYFILPVMLGLSMLVQHRLTPQTLDGAQAKIMGLMMPIFFTVIMLFLPAGLTLYIFVNTVLGVAHQWHVYQQPDKEEPTDKGGKKPTRKSWMQRMQQYVEEQQNAQDQKGKK